VARCELLLIIRHYNDDFRDRQVLRVEVFALDVNTSPYGLTEIHSFSGDCILVGSGARRLQVLSCQSAYGVEGDSIYFVPDIWSAAKLALWRHGMMSWCVCHGGCISKFSDIACTRGRSTYSVSSPQTTLSFTSRKTTDGFSR
jgi:hypothetical protein